MIGRAWGAGTRLAGSVAAWLDYGVAMIMACAEGFRLPAAEGGVREPVMVARAITLRGGNAVVHSIHLPANHRSLGRGATLAVAAAALAAMVGANGTLASAYSGGVPALAGDPVFLALRSSHALPGSSSLSADVRAGRTRVDLSGVIATPAAARPAPETFENPPRQLLEAVVLAPVATAAPQVAPVQAAPAVPAQPVVATAEPPAPTVRPIDVGAVVAAGSGIPHPLAEFVGVRYTPDEVRGFALAAGWPAERVEELLLVAWCESRLRPAARGGNALGLMQIMPFWFEHAGIDIAQWSDPVVNLRVAWIAFETDLGYGKAPWAAWVCKPFGSLDAASGR